VRNGDIILPARGKHCQALSRVFNGSKFRRPGIDRNPPPSPAILHPPSHRRSSLGVRCLPDQLQWIFFFLQETRADAKNPNLCGHGDKRPCLGSSVADRRRAIDLGAQRTVGRTDWTAAN